MNPVELRRKLNLNQQEFWAKIGVTQSGGSRYENGHKIPKAVKELMRLVYVEHIDVAELKSEDIAIIHYLKRHHPDLHNTLKKAVKSVNGVALR